MHNVLSLSSVLSNEGCCFQDSWFLFGPRFTVPSKSGFICFPKSVTHRCFLVVVLFSFLPFSELKISFPVPSLISFSRVPLHGLRHLSEVSVI